MPSHDELLEQGPHEAPEPETAEQRSLRNGVKAVGGGVLVGGIALFHGLLGKLVFLLIVWHGIGWAGRIGGWVGILLIVGIVLGAIAWGKAHIG